jgi:MraZ protein
MMFWGEYMHHLDTKGRLIVPARYRPKLAKGAILTRGLDRNLVIYPDEA